nr:MAG TPA: Protein of unknown function (DUF1492) [Caudoviricetes sp.]
MCITKLLGGNVLKQIIELGDKSIKRIALEVHKLDQKDKEKARKEFKSRSLHNTKLLLENYYKLKAHCDSMHTRINETNETSLWYKGRMTIDALMENQVKTVKMMWHVDDSLEKYRRVCKGETKKSKSRRYNILKDFYIDGLSIDRIADKYDVDRTTILRNKDDAIDDLSIYLFGIDIFNEL